MRAFTHDALFWRRLARVGAARFPSWWVHYSPPVFGVAAALAVPSARRAVIRNLHRIRGERGRARDAVDVARTFASYASCLAEVLSNGSKNERLPVADILNEPNVLSALAAKRGIVLVTMHTAGWETVGPLLMKDHAKEVIMVMAPEPNEGARELHDRARQVTGVKVAHVGEDPFAPLTLLHTLRRGGVVALQLDRTPSGIRARDVTLFDAPGRIPEGPLRLASLAGAPILPIFCARTAYRRYVIDVRPPITLTKRPSTTELDAAAQQLADEMTRFLRLHPTQWFHFGPG